MVDGEGTRPTPPGRAGGGHAPFMQAWPVAHAQKVAALARQEPAALITALPTNMAAPPPRPGPH